MRQIAILILFLMAASCKPEVYTPKPRGYARIDTPEHTYQPFERADYPYSFEYPVYGSISKDTSANARRPENPYWLNIEFPTLGGIIYLSYKVIDPTHPLPTLLDDSHEMSYFLTKRADYMNTPVFHTENNVHGVLYQVGGNAASAYQFFATDSTAHFLRAHFTSILRPMQTHSNPLPIFYTGTSGICLKH